MVGGTLVGSWCFFSILQSVHIISGPKREESYPSDRTREH